jgi:D-alanine-D-alanine ligase
MPLERRAFLFDAPMSAGRFRIALLYNDDSQIKNGDPQELLAVQYTVTTTQNLYDALASLGYPTERIAVRGSLEELAQALRGHSPEHTLIFNNCDGFDGSNQAAADVVRLIEALGFRHTGATGPAAELCINKPRAKDALLARNIPTPRYQVFRQASENFCLDFPVIVKPSVEDGSMGITLDSVVATPEKLCQQVQRILTTYNQPVLVEEFIPGRELAVAMLGNEEIEILPISEEDYGLIADPLQCLLTYEAKWDPQSAYYNDILARVPADLTPAEAEIVGAAAEGAFRAIGLRDFGRVDIRLRDGIPYVIDVNEIPDLALDAGFWNSARAAGMTYPQMVEKIIKHALQREGWIP